MSVRWAAFADALQLMTASLASNVGLPLRSGFLDYRSNTVAFPSLNAGAFRHLIVFRHHVDRG